MLVIMDLSPQVLAGLAAKQKGCRTLDKFCELVLEAYAEEGVCYSEEKTKEKEKTESEVVSLLREELERAKSLGYIVNPCVDERLEELCQKH